MKSLIFIASIFVGSAAFADANTCFQFSNGPKDVTVGWFHKTIITADTICVPANYPQQGFTEEFDFVFKSGTTVIATYKATAERYSDTDLRFTLNDGEPEPQQFDAEVTAKSKKLVEIKAIDTLVALSSGGLYECRESKPKLGATRSLKLTQIEDSTQWKLEVFSKVVAPNAQPKLILSSVLNVVLNEDVQFFLNNVDDNIYYHIFLDELYSTELYVGGESGESISFNCEGQE